MSRPSIQPSSRRRCRKAPTNGLQIVGVVAPRNPIVGDLPGCCARAASGHATAVPPSSVMNSRRPMSNMAVSSPPSACRAQPATVRPVSLMGGPELYELKVASIYPNWGAVLPPSGEADIARRSPRCHRSDCRHWRNGIYGMSGGGRSLRLDARELDHLGPFVGLGCNESAELGGAKNHWDGADIAEPRPDVRRSQPGIDLAVEPFDDLHWRAGGRAETVPGPRLVSRQRLGDGRHVRQHVESLAARHRERRQAA